LKTLKLNTFIKGELIDLCIPTREFAEKSDWYSWFNDPQITRYLDNGVFPNTRKKQVEFYESQRKQRLILIISNKNKYLGVINLSSLDLINKTANIALIVDSSKCRRDSPMISLEAMARVTEHAFTLMGIQRIFAGQHKSLFRWQQRIELLGYRVEGIKRQGFIKGQEVEDSISLSVLRKDYDKIIECRGQYWDSAENMFRRIKSLPKQRFAQKVYHLINNESDEYYSSIFSL